MSMARQADPREIFAPDDIVALRPVRFMPDDNLRNYTAFTFPDNPKGKCEMFFNRVKVVGGIADKPEEEAGLCDLLNAEGDIVSDFPLNKKGLRYLIKSLGCSVEN